MYNEKNTTVYIKQLIRYCNGNEGIRRTSVIANKVDDGRPLL